MDVRSILTKYKLPSIMTVRPDDLSGWMTPFSIDAHNICHLSGAEFVFLESSEMNAIAIQDEVEIVGVCAGMFWMLCRIAAVAAGKGVFPDMEGEIELGWEPDVLRSLQTPRELLSEGVQFDWVMESIGWKQAPERQILFYLILDILFRFVVFHELGHLQNDHGRRQKAQDLSPLFIDRLGPRLIDPADAIPSQAREIIADGYALEMTLKTLDTKLLQGAEFEMIQIIRKRLIPDNTALISFVLTIINLYFRTADRSDWEDLPINHLSHPPAPFRMKALFAHLVEQKPFNIDEMTAMSAVNNSRVSSDALMSVMLNIFPNPKWLNSISTSAHDYHFAQLYEELPRWSGRMSD